MNPIASSFRRYEVEWMDGKPLPVLYSLMLEWSLHLNEQFTLKWRGPGEIVSNESRLLFGMKSWNHDICSEHNAYLVAVVRFKAIDN